MIALIDVGNTNSKLAYWHDNNFSAIKVVPHERLLEELSNGDFSIKKIIIANVGLVTSELNNQLNDLKGIEIQTIETEKFRFGVTCCYENPNDFGVDRWLTLLAVHQQYQNENILIVDSGTATTIDVLNQNGNHLGGWIIPGIEMMRSSINQLTTRINVPEIEVRTLALGSTTEQNVNIGIYSATIGLVDQGLSNAKRLNCEISKIVVTGGNGKKLSTLLNSPNEFVSDLVFKGMSLYI